MGLGLEGSDRAGLLWCCRRHKAVLRKTGCLVLELVTKIWISESTRECFQAALGILGAVRLVVKPLSRQTISLV